MAKKCTWPRFRMDRGVPCGPTNSTTPEIPCCATGDICVSNSICRFTHSLDGGSGYYAAGCTDEEFSSSACAKRCEKQGWPDIVYDKSSENWKCCGADEDEHRNCADPSDNSFLAPPPGDLVDYWTAGQTDIPWTTAAASATSSSTPTSTPTSISTSKSASNSAPASTESTSSFSSSSEEDDSALSTGAKAGIGVGVAIGALLVLVGLALWLRERKQKKRSGSAVMPTMLMKPPPSQYNVHQGQPETSYTSPRELPGNDRSFIAELDGSR